MYRHWLIGEDGYLVCGAETSEADTYLSTRVTCPACLKWGKKIQRIVFTFSYFFEARVAFYRGYDIANNMHRRAYSLTPERMRHLTHLLYNLGIPSFYDDEQRQVIYGDLPQERK